MIFYESPHRLLKTLEQLGEYLGSNRQVCVSRELTKIFEENRRGTVLEILTHYQQNPNTIKGEIVIIVAGKV